MTPAGIRERIDAKRGGDGLDILCIGEPMVEFNDRGDGLWLCGFGGDVSNAAIAAARQGAKTGVFTRLGAESFGDDIAALWREEKVADLAPRDDKRQTGLYFVRHGPDGHRFEYRRAGSAASAMTPGDLPQGDVAACRVLHASGISHAISDSAAETVDAAIAAARAGGALISYDTNLRLSLWPIDRAREVIHGVMPSVDIALPSLDDAELLCGLTEPEAIAKFYLDLGPSIVALTLGAEGALVASREGVLRIPARRSDLVDASGAGDCFDGAFLAELLSSGDAEAAGRYAVAAASLAIQGAGAVAPLPYREQVASALASV